jgi:hypothetical protein
VAWANPEGWQKVAVGRLGQTGNDHRKSASIAAVNGIEAWGNSKDSFCLSPFGYGGFKKGCVAPKAKAIRSGVTW